MSAIEASETLTGGCQCGAVRFATKLVGRGSICHCRMCQKAFGSFFGPLVTSHDGHWTPRVVRFAASVERRWPTRPSSVWSWPLAPLTNRKKCRLKFRSI
jgi:hypothetical protein